MTDPGTSSITRALQLAPIGEGRYRVAADRPLLNFQSAFGGWGLAALLTAIQAEEPALPPLASVNAVFLKAIPAQELEIRVSPLREGRKAAFWRAELVAVETQAALLSGDFIFSALKEADIDYKRPFPEVVPFAEAPILPNTPGPMWLKDFEQRIGAGQPFSAQDRPYSAFWFNDPAQAGWDTRSILLVSDTPMPRTFFVDPMPRFGATVAFSFFVVADFESLGSAHLQPLLVEADSDSVGNGRFAQNAHIWSSDGTLLAISNQLALY